MVCHDRCHYCQMTVMNGCIFGFSFITCILKLGSKHSSREDLTKTGNDLGGQKKRKKLDSNIASIFHFAVLLPIFRFTKDFGQFLFGSAYEERDIKVCNFATFEFDLFEPKYLNWVLPKVGRKGSRGWFYGADSWHWQSFRQLLRYSKKVWLRLPHRLLKQRFLFPTVLFRTTTTRTVTFNPLKYKFVLFKSYRVLDFVLTCKTFFFPAL